MWAVGIEPGEVKHQLPLERCKAVGDQN